MNNKNKIGDGIKIKDDLVIEKEEFITDPNNISKAKKVSKPAKKSKRGKAYKEYDIMINTQEERNRIIQSLFDSNNKNNKR